MKKPLVSILIPTYNREDLIECCIQSAINQTITDIEVIVVDNNSTDNTWEICKKISDLDSRIRIFKNDKNIGPVLNWQRCINEARGEFGKILFSDDLLHPENLEKTLPYIKNDATGFVITAIQLGVNPSEARLEASFVKKSGIYKSSEFINASLYKGSVTVSPGNALFRINDLKKNLKLQIPSPTINDFLCYGAGPDLLLYLLTANNYPNIAFVYEPLAFFRSHPGSITASTNIRKYYNQAYIWYAENYLLNEEYKDYLVYSWYKHIQNSRPKKYIRPSIYLKDYISSDAPELMSSILKFFARKILDKFTRKKSI